MKKPPIKNKPKVIIKRTIPQPVLAVGKTKFTVDTIKISPLKYKVFFVDHIKDENDKFLTNLLNDGEAIGLTVVEKEEILISTKLTKNIELITLLHETFHAILYTRGGCLSHATPEVENYIECLANGFIDVCKNNPKFLKYFLDNIQNTKDDKTN